MARTRQTGGAPPPRTCCSSWAADLRRLPGSPAYTEYLAILNWLGEFDVMEEFAERANAYRARIGVDQWPRDRNDYVRALIALAREIAGA